VDRYATWLDRDALRVAGPESQRYLQGQLTQDVDRLAEGDSRWSFVLSPTGKVDALVRVTRTGAEEWLLDTDAGYGDALLERLARFKLRTRVQLEPLEVKVLALRGAVAEGSAGGPAATAGSLEATAGGLGATAGSLEATAGGPEAAPARGTRAVSFDWPGFAGVDLFVEGAELVEPPAGWPLAPAERYESDRIVAGFPRMGAELTDKTIPAETGLVARTVSFTKGCYTGQELVARIDSRGSHVAKHLRALRCSEGISAGQELLGAERVVGAVTSACPMYGKTGWVGLGYVHRSVEVPARLASAGGATVAVFALTE
jgi:folate-binding protein YgfZ